MALKFSDYWTALYESRGLISVAARRLNVTPAAVRAAIRRHPRLQEALDDAREAMGDQAESALWLQIQDGNVAATIFYLKTVHKHRGYVERTEQSISHSGPIIVDLTVSDIAEPSDQ